MNFTKRPLGWRKYHEKKTIVEGIIFASKLESRRFQELKLLCSAGEIKDLGRQKKYVFIVNGIRIGSYTADFVYINSCGQVIVEDTKGVKTRDWPLRKKLMKACFGIEVQVL